MKKVFNIYNTFEYGQSPCLYLQYNYGIIQPYLKIVKITEGEYGDCKDFIKLNGKYYSYKFVSELRDYIRSLLPHNFILELNKEDNNYTLSMDRNENLSIFNEIILKLKCKIKKAKFICYLDGDSEIRVNIDPYSIEIYMYERFSDFSLNICNEYYSNNMKDMESIELARKYIFMLDGLDNLLKCCFRKD